MFHSQDLSRLRVIYLLDNLLNDWAVNVDNLFNRDFFKDLFNNFLDYRTINEDFLLVRDCNWVWSVDEDLFFNWNFFYYFDRLFNGYDLFDRYL